MWDLLAERKRSGELEDRYSLMLRELRALARDRPYEACERVRVDLRRAARERGRRRREIARRARRAFGEQCSRDPEA